MNALVPVLRRLSPAGANGRLSILIFHRVLAQADPLFPDLPDATRFGAILDWLRAWFNILPLDDAVRRLSAGALPERAAVITFDDGYADNHAVALPELQRRGLPATFFIATGFLDGGRMWNDTVIESIRGCRQAALELDALGLGRMSLTTTQARREAIDRCIAHLKYLPTLPRAEAADALAARACVEPPNDLMMTSEGVRALHRAGMQIGAHTVTHPILARLSRDDARREMHDSRTRLEDIVGARIGLFAYPNGKPGDDYTDEHARMAREIGFDAALSTQAGAARAATDMMQLPRFTPWDRGRARFGVRLAANLFAS